MMNKYYLSLAVAIVLCVVLVAQSSAYTLFSEDFEAAEPEVDITTLGWTNVNGGGPIKAASVWKIDSGHCCYGTYMSTNYTKRIGHEMSVGETVEMTAVTRIDGAAPMVHIDLLMGDGSYFVIGHYFTTTDIDGYQAEYHRSAGSGAEASDQITHSGRDWSTMDAVLKLDVTMTGAGAMNFVGYVSVANGPWMQVANKVVTGVGTFLDSIGIRTRERGWLDTINITSTGANGALGGMITLGDWVGNAGPAAVSVQLIPTNGGSSKAAQQISAATNTCAYLVDNVTPGTYDVTFSSSNGLIQTVRDVVVTSGNLGTADVMLVKGAVSASRPTDSMSPEVKPSNASAPEKSPDVASDQVVALAKKGK